MPESLRSRLLRWRFNLFPAYFGTGARITYLADDFREVRVELPLSWRTRNLVGSIFGGSMYGAVDPVYMTMLIHNLGEEYVVWDKAANIRFRRPGRETLHARFLVEQEELDEIRGRLAPGQALERVYGVELKNRDGVVHAEIEKILHVRRRASDQAR